MLAGEGNAWAMEVPSVMGKPTIIMVLVGRHKVYIASYFVKIPHASEWGWTAAVKCTLMQGSISLSQSIFIGQRVWDGGVVFHQ